MNISLSGNLADNWFRFTQHVKSFFKASVPATAKTGKPKVIILLHVADRDVVNIFKTFTLTEDRNENYLAIVRKLQEYFAPKAKEFFEHHTFRETR